MVSRSKYPDVRIPDDQTVPTYVLQNAAKRFADKVALIDAVSGESITYGRLVSGVRRVASGLARRGLRQAPGAHLDTAPAARQPLPGTPVVCIFAANNIYYPVVVHAVLALGGVVTAADPASTPEELRSQLAVSGAQYVITDRSRLADTELTTKLWPVKEVLLFEENSSGHVSVSDLLADDGKGLPTDIVVRPTHTIALVPFITDRDGWPKGVLHTHQTFNANVAIMSSPCISPASSYDVMLSCLPMGSFHGLMSYCGWALREGVTQIVMPKYSDGAVLSAVEKFRVTVAHAMPAVAEYLAFSPDIHRADICSLRHLYAGGAPVRQGVVAEMMARTSINEYREGLHLAEACAIFAVPRGDTLPGYVGTVGPNTKVKILDIFFGGYMEPEMDGEICVSGPQVALGYLTDRDVDTSSIDQDGWLHTGYIGHINRTGNFTVVGQIDDLVGYDLFKIVPRELETIVRQMPGVSDVAVVGVTDCEGREVPRAYVIKATDTDVSQNEICQHVSENVHNHKQLRGGVVFIDTLPRTSCGELQSHRLRTMATESVPKNKTKVQIPDRPGQISDPTGQDNKGMDHTSDQVDNQIKNGHQTKEIILDSPVNNSKSESELGDFLSWNVMDRPHTHLNDSVITNQQNMRNCSKDVWMTTEGVGEVGVNVEPTLKTQTFISIRRPATDCKECPVNGGSKHPHQPDDSITTTGCGSGSSDRNSLRWKHPALPSGQVVVAGVRNAYNVENRDIMSSKTSDILSKDKLNTNQNTKSTASDEDEDAGQWEDALEVIPSLQTGSDTTKSRTQQVQNHSSRKHFCCDNVKQDEMGVNSPEHVTESLKPRPGSTNVTPSTNNDPLTAYGTGPKSVLIRMLPMQPNGNACGVRAKGSANGILVRHNTSPDTETNENGSVQPT